MEQWAVQLQLAFEDIVFHLNAAHLSPSYFYVSIHKPTSQRDAAATGIASSELFFTLDNTVSFLSISVLKTHF